MHSELVLLRKFLSSIPFINSGGCAISALAMYEVAKKLGIDAHIIYLYDDLERYSQNSYYKLVSRDQPRSCDHAICKIDGMYIDCMQTVNTSNFNYAHILPKYVVIDSIIKDRWNPTFDRQRYLPVIETYIGKKLLMNNNQEVWDWINDHPDDTFTDIGVKFNLSVRTVQSLSLLQAAGEREKFDDLLELKKKPKEE